MSEKERREAMDTLIGYEQQILANADGRLTS